MRSKRTFNAWPLLVVTLGIIWLILTAPSKVWTMLLVILGLVQLLSWLWIVSLGQHVRLVRERRYTWASVGDRIEERFTLHNPGFFPALWVEVEDRSTLPGYNTSRSTGVMADSYNRWTNDGVCTHRGVFRLGPTRLRFSDPLGLFTVEQFYPNSVDMVIFPPVVPLPSFPIDTRGQFGETLRRYSMTQTEAAAGVRPYNVGDSLNRIHWPTTARRDSFYVRQFDPASAGSWWLLLDVDPTVHVGEGINSTLEKAVVVAASLADHGLNLRQAVGFLSQCEQTGWLPPQLSNQQKWHLLKLLAQVQPTALPLADLLWRSRPLLAQRASLIIITTATSLNWLDALLHLQHQGVAPTVIFLYRSETNQDLLQAYYLLRGQAITVHLLDVDTVTVPETDGQAGLWTWRILATGKAVAVHKPEGGWEVI